MRYLDEKASDLIIKKVIDEEYLPSEEYFRALDAPAMSIVHVPGKDFDGATYSLKHSDCQYFLEEEGMNIFGTYLPCCKFFSTPHSSAKKSRTS